MAEANLSANVERSGSKHAALQSDNPLDFNRAVNAEDFLSFIRQDTTKTSMDADTIKRPVDLDRLSQINRLMSANSTAFRQTAKSELSQIDRDLHKAGLANDLHVVGVGNSSGTVDRINFSKSGAKPGHDQLTLDMRTGQVYDQSADLYRLQEHSQSTDFVLLGSTKETVGNFTVSRDGTGEVTKVQSEGKPILTVNYGEGRVQNPRQQDLSSLLDATYNVKSVKLFDGSEFLSTSAGTELIRAGHKPLPVEVREFMGGTNTIGSTTVVDYVHRTASDQPQDLVVQKDLDGSIRAGLFNNTKRTYDNFIRTAGSTEWQRAFPDVERQPSKWSMLDPVRNLLPELIKDPSYVDPATQARLNNGI
jgi:hypothetical protein